MKGSTAPSIALAGNPNTGKSTLFNALTGSRQHVANYPGMTVEKRTGSLTYEGQKVSVIDLPGTYSLTAYSDEERVARRLLIEEKPDVVIVVLAASALERNLYLVVQILELGLPVVLGLNMMDEVRKMGISIDIKKLSAAIGAPVVPIVAKKGEGIKELLDTAMQVAQAPEDQDRAPLELSYGEDLDNVIVDMSRLLENSLAWKNSADALPPRWVAIKYLEGDTDVMELGQQRDPAVHAKLLELTEKAAEHCRKTLDTYPEAMIADYRYGFINSVLRDGVVSSTEEDRSRRIALSDRLDMVLTNRLFGPIIMLAVLYLVYQFTFVFGEYPMEILADWFGELGEWVEEHMAEGLLRSLLVSGIIDGVGGVIGFVPLIIVMFLFVAFLDDTGYMARMAYMLDRVFKTFGLHGSSVMPFIISGGIAGGCAVPGVLACRTLRSPKERLATMLTIPFLNCGAKLPVFLLLTSILFPSWQALAMFLITLTGWAAALIVAKFLRLTMIKGKGTPFVMELPPYRMPTLRGVLIHTWERSWEYLKRAGTILLAVSIVLWAAMTFPRLSETNQGQKYSEQVATLEQNVETANTEKSKEEAQENLEELEKEVKSVTLTYSLAGRLGVFMEPVTSLAGFDWRTNIALIGGLAAKEVVISTLGTAYSLGDVADDDEEQTKTLAQRIQADPSWSTAKGISLCVFMLLYAPCVATLACIAKESASAGWTLFSMTFNTALAFVVAIVVYQVLLLF